MYHWRDDLWKNMVDSTKKWERIKSEYSRYIKTEKRLSENTVAAYMRDFEEFMHYILRNYGVSYEAVNAVMIERFMAWLFERGTSEMAQRPSLSRASQARRLSGIKSFYNFLLLTEKIEQLPTEGVGAPKAERLLPDATIGHSNVPATL